MSKQMLASLALTIEERNVARNLTPEELEAGRKRLMELEISQDISDEVHKGIVDEYNEVKKKRKSEMVTLIRQERKGLVEEIATCYDVPDYETGMMTTYNEEGEVLSTRKLRANERQTIVYQMKKAGNEYCY